MSTSLAPRPGRPAPLLPAGAAGRELLARFYRALGDPTRLDLLAFCADAERTGTECVERAGLSQGRVSAHLACLVSCGLLSARRQGRFAYYQLADPKVAEMVALGQDMVAAHAASIAACTKVAPSAVAPLPAGSARHLPTAPQDASRAGAGDYADLGEPGPAVAVAPARSRPG